ncbi:MAG: hypothetical protein PSN34_06320 [Urechidicola sp.]|nr:hypothetical protein [Urechidicola sp.]
MLTFMGCSQANATPTKKQTTEQVCNHSFDAIVQNLAVENATEVAQNQTVIINVLTVDEAMDQYRQYWQKLAKETKVNTDNYFKDQMHELTSIDIGLEANCRAIETFMSTNKVRYLVATSEVNKVDYTKVIRVTKNLI